MWYRLPVDICNNTRANDTTPPQCIEERIYFDFPPEFNEWARANTPDLLPPEAEGFIDESPLFSPLAIISPRFPDQISGVVEVFGSTNVDNLSYYQIGFGAGNEPTTFIQIGENGKEQGFNQLLGQWNTSELSDGVYTLHLQIVTEDNRVQTTSTRVTVDNTPPEIRMVEPQQAATYSASTDVVVNLDTEVFDARDIDRVEFYIDSTTTADAQTLSENGVKIGESTAFPYTMTWTIEESGLRTFWAVAYDRAGNPTASNRVIVTLENE
jgi:hypothetical protein